MSKTSLGINGNHVVFVIADMHGGGTQRAVSYLIEDFVASGTKVDLITLSRKESDFYPVPASVGRYVVNVGSKELGFPSRLVANFIRLLQIRRLLKLLKPQSVVAFIAPTNVLVILASVGLKCKTVISERNDPSKQSFGFFWDNARRIFYRFANIVTANTEGAVESLRAFVPQQKLRYAPNLLPRLKKTSDRLLPAPFFLSVGRLHDQKGHDLILRAFAHIRKQLPNWRLEIVGEGDLRSQLIDLARTLGISDEVSFPGQVHDIDAYYRQASVFILASRHEGTPNVILEALGFGLPVLVSDASPGPLEIVENEVNGLVFRSENIDELAERMLRLAVNPDLREAFAEACSKKLKIQMDQNPFLVWKNILLGV